MSSEGSEYGDGANAQAFPENPFESESSRILFDAIDELQRIQASRDVEIPQLVIVGGQSTGKSSLLQALTEIPFPVGQGCCTRFATRIVSRRTEPGSRETTKIEIVRPDFDLDDCFGYDYDYDYDDETVCEEIDVPERLDPEGFTKIFERVSTEYLGIKPGKGPGTKNFATEVLKIELSGPNRSHFSILDIPGVIASANDVNPEERRGVKQMAIEYVFTIKKPQNIVICVAEAVSDLANQITSDLVQAHVDPSRLIMVFSKCDLAHSKSEAVRIAAGDSENTSRITKHGWFVVRNRTGDEDESFNLDAAEKELFSGPGWNRVAKNRRGTKMLRQFLASMLCDKIRDDFPKLQRNVIELLQEQRYRKESLGDPRTTVGEKIAYINQVVSRYSNAAKQALTSPGHLPEDNMRLRAIVSRSNVQFDEQMRREGHTHSFDWPVFENRADPFVSEPQPVNPMTPPVTPESKPNHRISAKQPGNKNGAETKPGEELRRNIQIQFDAFQSGGLPGLLNTEMIPVVYKEQIKKWMDMGHDHVRCASEASLEAAKSILALAFEDLPHGPEVREELEKMILDFNATARARAEAETKAYCEAEKRNPASATNRNFRERLGELRAHRFVVRAKTEIYPTMEVKMVDFSDVRQWAGLYDLMKMNTDEVMMDEVHDAVKVYYEMSVQTYIDYVNKRVIEGLISSDDGALLGLSTEYITRLPEEDIDRIAGETRETIVQREQCVERITRLEKASSIVQTAMRRTAPSIAAY